MPASVSISSSSRARLHCRAAWNFLPISNRRTRVCCRRRFSRQACTRPVHSDTRMSLKSAEIGFASCKARGVRKELLLQCRIDEAVGDDLAIAAIGHGRQQSIVRHPRLGRTRPRSAARSRALSRDAVEAAQARHLLDEVLLDADIEAMRRLDARASPPAVASTRSLTARSTACTSSSGTLAPSNRAKRARRKLTQPVGLGARRPRRAVTCTGPGSPPAISSSSAVARSMASAGSVGSTPRSNRCAASVKSPRRRARPAIASGAKCAASSSTSRGRIGNRRAPPAHDAGKADRAARIRDHQELGIELVFFVVQQRNALSRPSPVCTLMPSAQLGEIVGVHAAGPNPSSRNW